MEQRITHACGHEQVHFFTGFASQHDRKAQWLRTTKCRPCFVAERNAAQADAASRDGAAIAHLDLALLTGSERQVAWATTIRAGRLAALIVEPTAVNTSAWQACLPITDAKWWIDHRALTNVDLLAKAACYAGATSVATDLAEPSDLSRAA